MAPELLCGTAKYLSYPRAIDIFRCLSSRGSSCGRELSIQHLFTGMSECVVLIAYVQHQQGLMLTKFFATGSFGVLLHEVVSGVRPKLCEPMEPLRRVAGMLHEARAKSAQTCGLCVNLIFILVLDRLLT